MANVAGDVRGKRVLIVAGTGPVGIRAAGLFAKAGADVCITSRKAEAGERARDLVLKRVGGKVRAIAMADASEAGGARGRARPVPQPRPARGVVLPPQGRGHPPGGQGVAGLEPRAPPRALGA